LGKEHKEQHQVVEPRPGEHHANGEKSNTSTYGEMTSGRSTRAENSGDGGGLPNRGRRRNYRFVVTAGKKKKKGNVLQLTELFISTTGPVLEHQGGNCSGTSWTTGKPRSPRVEKRSATRSGERPPSSRTHRVDKHKRRNKMCTSGQRKKRTAWFSHLGKKSETKRARTVTAKTVGNKKGKHETTGKLTKQREEGANSNKSDLRRGESVGATRKREHEALGSRNSLPISLPLKKVRGLQT